MLNLESAAGIGSASQRTADLQEPPLLWLHGISKRFPGVQALSNVGLSLQAGEVVAIVGENGAGKSTLLKILGGILSPDEGTISVRGRPIYLRNVRQALSLGIALIHQELNLAPSITVAENIFLGRQPFRGSSWLPFTDRRRLHDSAAYELRRVGLSVAPNERLGRLGIAHRQLVEIAKALATNAQILILDEPTSSLSLSEADRLLTIVEGLRDRGVGILYVSHRLREVQRIADRVVVLRDGRHVADLTREEASPRRMISHMVGRDLLPTARRPHAHANSTPAIAVRELRLTDSSPTISFAINPGEVVGLAGLVGAGRTELAEAIFGIRRPAAGRIELDGREMSIRGPRDAINAGIAFVPEDRKAHGVVLDKSVRSNISLAILNRLARYGRYDRRAEYELATKRRQSLNIRCSSLEVKVASLSGGNQQKVVLAKWLATEPNVFILDEPTRGVDVGAKQEIYALINKLAAQGTAIMLISSEMEEVIALSDRVLVMNQGAIAGELVGDQITEDRIMRLAIGDQADEVAEASSS
jgi:ribose transport system ATP-binding protein